MEDDLKQTPEFEVWATLHGVMAHVSSHPEVMRTSLYLAFCQTVSYVFNDIAAGTLYFDEVEDLKERAERLHQAYDPD